MSPQEIRNTLIERTISVIASEGLDKTTTKAIVTGTGINEAYIYRNFSDKEDLLAKTFDFLDEELLSVVVSNLSVMYSQERSYRERCRVYFSAVWDFLLGNREKCLAFIRYYYSPYFKKNSAKIHKHRFRPLAEEFAAAFKVEANVWMLMNHMMNTMLDFAVKIFNDEVPDNEDTEEHVFRLVYHSMVPYFRQSIPAGA